MIPCERSTGRLFLDGQLAESQEKAFAEHVESCDRCRQWLEQDAGDDVTWQLARELSVQEKPTLGQVAQQIKHYLSASDDPAMMGRVGPYEVVGVVGRGGMGIVLKAFERSLSRNVAIKLLDPSLAALGSARSRFAREAKAMAAVSHAHVVPIFAVDEHEGLPYFVMDYVVGETLEQRLRRDGPLDAASIVRVALQVAEALAAAHSQGLVHRDIKPGNILLDRGTERVRVADFGLARVASDVSQTHSAVVAGTPQYMSPEQVRAESCDGRSDLFSLGSVMYAMCTGHAPFRADSVYSTMQRIAHDEPRSLREQNAEVPQWLENFIFRLLSKKSGQRFESADEVARILRGELNHMLNPTQVKKPSRPWEQIRRSRYQSPLVWILAVPLLAITAFVAIPLGDRSPPDDEQQGNPPRQSVPAGETILLWDVDGTLETRRRADALERGLQSNFVSQGNWQQDVDVIRSRMTHLLNEPF